MTDFALEALRRRLGGLEVDSRPLTKDEQREAGRVAEEMQRHWAALGIPGGWRPPARRQSGSRGAKRWERVVAIRAEPTMTDDAIRARARKLDYDWPEATDWHSQDAERQRLGRLRIDAAANK
jgi:hypothetical protein